MALLSQQVQRFLLTKYNCHDSLKSTSNANRSSSLTVKARIRSCSAIAIDAQSSSLTDEARIRWGSTTLQGARDEMEDDIVVRPDGLDGFSFAAVFDGHAGVSSVKFLRFGQYFVGYLSNFIPHVSLCSEFPLRLACTCLDHVSMCIITVPRPALL